MDHQQANLRKLEWPASGEQAVNYIHGQCQVFSQSGVPSPQELSNIIQFIDEFVFSTGKPVKPGKKPRRLTNIQQLQLIQILFDYFTSDDDFNLLCSVFMIIFMVQGRDIEYKVSTLSRLLSLGLGLNSTPLLNLGGVWLTQQTPSSVHSQKVARHLVQEDICSQTSHNNLQQLPNKSPLFTANLISAVAELYTKTSPPAQLVKLVTSWLCDQSTLTGTSPVASLLSWTVLAPLDSGETYSLLHFTLLESLQGSKLVTKTLVQLADNILAKIEGQSDENIMMAMDRFGQVMAASNSPLDKDLITLINQLPANRLVQMVTDAKH